MDPETDVHEVMEGEEKAPLMGVSDLEAANGWSLRPDIAFHIIGIFLLTCSAVFYASILLRSPSDMECARLNWAWSPLMEGFEFQWRRFDSNRIPTTYMGPPTLERREAWENLSRNGWIEFPRSQFPIVDKQNEGHIWIGPPPPRQDQVVAQPEVVHQIHCLAEIYEFVHRAEWDFSEYYTRLIIFKLHANHCFHVIMNLISCNADITPVLFQRNSRSRQRAWETVDAPHLCKDWDVLGRWHAEHKVCDVNCYPEHMEPEVYFKNKHIHRQTS